MSQYTVIPLARWIDNGSYKMNGDLILDGAITDEQLDALKAALAGEIIVASRLEEVLGFELDDCSGESIYTYLRDTAAEHIRDYKPGWDEITIDLTDTGVTIDAFIAATQKVNDSPNGWKTDEELQDERRAAARAEIDARALAWFTARNALAEMNEATDCAGAADDCACDDTGTNDSCADCGVHGDTYDQMVKCIDAATALVAVLAEQNQITVGAGGGN